MAGPIVQIKFRFESADAYESRYVFRIGEDTDICRVYIDNLTWQVSFSRPEASSPTHFSPLVAPTTTEPDQSEQGGRTGTRVSGSGLGVMLYPYFSNLTVALLCGKTVGPIIALGDAPMLTDEDLAKFFKE